MNLSNEKGKCIVCGKNAPHYTSVCDPAETLHMGGKYPVLYMCSEHQSQFVKLIRSDIFRMRLNLQED